MDSFANFLRTLGPGRIVALLGVSAGLIGFFFIVTMRIAQPQMGLLYSNLELDEAASIMQQLDQAGVPYELGNDGSTIMAPTDRITTLRVTMAGEGLGGSIVGYEIFDRSDSLGTTSFVQNINRVRAIEGELARTIREITAVNSARVHIVLPERQLFERENSEPSASIVLKTSGGRLSQNQIQAIQHLVAAAVPNLDPGRVSMVDQRGTLLAKGEGDNEASFSTSMAERKSAIESRFRGQLETLLGQTVGMGRVRAEIAVELNTNRLTTNTETFDPDGQVVRSSESSEETSNDQDSSPAGTVSIADNLPDGQGDNTTDTSTASTNRIQETTNFEISRTMTTEVREPGEILHISVAVLVDGNYTTTTDADGVDTRTYQPRSQDEMDNIEALVRSAIGIDDTRGDSVVVRNMRFAEIEEIPPGPAAFNLMGLTKEDLVLLVERGGAVLLMILVLLLIVRPLIMKLVSSIPEAAASQPQLAAAGAGQAAIAGPEGYGGELPAVGEADALADLTSPAGGLSRDRQGIDAAIDVAQVEGKVQDSALKKVGDIVSRHPEEAASIVRAWLYSD